MSAPTVKRLAASILGVGVNRIRIKDGEIQRAEDALTREDVRGLLDEGAVYCQRFVGHRTKPLGKKKRAGRRKGTKYSRKGAKETWMEKIRAQRGYLNALFDDGSLKPEYRRQIYLKIKGGAFKGKAAMLIYLKENGMLAKEVAPKMVRSERRKERARNAPAQKKATSAPAVKAAPAAAAPASAPKPRERK